MWQRCVDAARQAPSKHNAQPWWFELAGDAVELHADGARAMPVSDPNGRELVMGCGAALLNLCVALRGEGRDPDVELFPAGARFSVVARVAAGAVREPTAAELALLAAIPQRHTNRNPLDGSRLSPDLPFLLQRAAEQHGAVLHLVPAAGARNAMEQIVARADRTAARDPGFAAELRAWTRPPGSTAEDGVPASAAGPGAAAAYRARFVERDFDVYGAVPSGLHDVSSDDDPLLAVLWTPGDTPADWVRAGMALEFVLLTVTAAGAAASLLNQPVEIPPLRDAVRREIGVAGWPQAILRIGVGAPVTPTPRRPVDDVLVSP